MQSTHKLKADKKQTMKINNPDIIMKRVKEQMGYVVLSTGIRADDVPYYAYVYMPIEQYLQYQTIRQQGGFNLADYGTIILQGEGETPPDHIKKEMKEKYNVDDKFEENLEALIQQIIPTQK